MTPMTTIKTPIEIYKEVKAKMDEAQCYNLETFANELSEAYHNQFDCIDKQTAIDFCQSMLKDYSTIEVTAETLNNFLNTLI
jgi:hypothetical protein